MNADLEAIRDAMDKTTGDGRDLDGAVALADAYVAANPDQFTEPMLAEAVAERKLDNLVHAIEVLRDAGLHEREWQLMAFELSTFHRQEIGGAVQPVLREQAVSSVPNARAKVRNTGKD